jgi:hypothetical protein
VTVSFPQPEPPPAAGRRLSRLLSRWAVARRLGLRQAEAIRQAVVAVPDDLGFDWWWRLLDPERGSVFRATASRSDLARASWPTIVSQPISAIVPFLEEPAGPGDPGFMVWAPEEAEYQPYLRLT